MSLKEFRRGNDGFERRFRGVDVPNEGIFEFKRYLKRTFDPDPSTPAISLF
jgi:hypothetical protein